MQLLLLISGRSDVILQKNNIYNDIQIIKIDEKDLVNFNKILKLVRDNKYSAVYFGTVDISFQRFHFFMKAYILLSNSKKGGVIDEFGKKNLLNIPLFFIKEFPLFIIELIFSLFLIIYYYLKFPVIKWVYLKKK